MGWGGVCIAPACSVMVPTFAYMWSHFYTLLDVVHTQVIDVQLHMYMLRIGTYVVRVCQKNSCTSITVRSRKEKLVKLFCSRGSLSVFCD